MDAELESQGPSSVVDPVAASDDEKASQAGSDGNEVSEPSGPIRYKTNYISAYRELFLDGPPRKPVISVQPKESVVFEYVEVRQLQQNPRDGSDDAMVIAPSVKARSYINILSPAVAEAVRCVVDYFPGTEGFSGDAIQIYEPYTILVLFEQELTQYRERVATLAEGESEPSTCANRHAAEHIAIVQDFVRAQTHEVVDIERERHARGYATFDMLWLLFKPGSDVYFDANRVGEHQPYVVGNVEFNMTDNNVTGPYSMVFWNLNANSKCIGPEEHRTTLERYAGEQKITSLRAYPCEYLRFADDVDKGDIEAIKQHFVNRGKQWYSFRRQKGPYHFDGFTATFPRRRYTSLVMVDPIQYYFWDGSERQLLAAVECPPGPLRICPCDRCEELIYRHAAKPKFAGYTAINPLTVDNLSDHQYFLCSQMVDAFLFKIRAWKSLQVDGFGEACFDGTLFERLVLKDSTKELIKTLTQMYIRDGAVSGTGEENQFTSITRAHKTPKQQTPTPHAWSADFIEGKGEGLTILLHGKPGVGKTYTAECIADYTERPLLSLTCSDIGVKPDVVEGNLLKWFKLAEYWGSIILIDEADIYMEQRQVQDVERNHLVAGFLRALEYYRGILFLTTNRVGTFDEAFISRIHIQIHYPDFEDAERDQLWQNFFDKLEEEREATMRITQSAKDFIQSQELRALKWNGREIRNAFQVAVALAEAKSQKDKEGRTLIKSDHIKATVQMSREFRDYLIKLHRVDLSKRASMLGNRYDAFGKENERTGKY